MPILNKYKRWIPQISLLMDEYWDMVLSQKSGEINPDYDESAEKCLSSFIDFTDERCIETERDIVSSPDYSWEKAVNDGYALEDIGFTGMDNGRILFDKFNPDLTDEIFYTVYLTGSIEGMESGDTRLHLKAVSGNTQLYDYDYWYDDEHKCMSFNGGFFQGFYKLKGFNYSVLPTKIEDEWNLEFVIRPMEYLQKPNTLNSFYPENSGIFFYMGTRAENKFAQFYNSNIADYPVVNGRYDISDEYFSFDWVGIPDENARRILNRILLLNFLYSDFSQMNNVCPCGRYGQKPYNRINEMTLRKYYDYIDNEDIYGSDGESLVVKTKGGADASKRGYFEIETDNKYLFFNRTKEGFNVDTWDTGTTVVITGYTVNLSDNLFLTVHRGKDGLITDDIRAVEEASGDTSFYNINNDTIGNAFALKVNEDGSIGYKYMLRDCDVTEPSYDSGYSVVEEYSFKGEVPLGEWTTINVRFKPIAIGAGNGKRMMKMYFYINGKLKFISQMVPEFNFFALDETFDKQEGVPYNISIGGGTQGLMESIWLDYMRAFDRKLPLEKNFAGTFIGDIKSFKFFTCPLTFNEIQSNYRKSIKWQ